MCGVQWDSKICGHPRLAAGSIFHRLRDFFVLLPPAAAMYTTKEGLWQPVEEGALAPLSGKYLLRLQKGLAGVSVSGGGGGGCFWNCLGGGGQLRLQEGLTDVLDQDML